MKITELKKREDLISNPKLNEMYTQFNELIIELNSKNLPEKTIIAINNEIEEINTSEVNNNFKKLIVKKQTSITRLLEKEHKLVTKNYYRTLWLILGMSAIGIPIGVLIGTTTKNMGLLTIGLPIGMVIGVALGTAMDKKAFNDGRQLKTELKYT